MFNVSQKIEGKNILKGAQTCCKNAEITADTKNVLLVSSIY